MDFLKAKRRKMEHVKQKDCPSNTEHLCTKQRQWITMPWLLAVRPTSDSNAGSNLPGPELPWELSLTCMTWSLPPLLLLFVLANSLSRPSLSQIPNLYTYCFFHLEYFILRCSPTGYVLPFWCHSNIPVSKRPSRAPGLK